MNPPKIDRAVSALTTFLRESPGIQAAILYGSAARGTARADSDLDLLVLMVDGDPEALKDGIRDLEREHDVDIAPYVLRPDELHGLDRQFLDSILRDGIPLVGSLPAVTLQELRLRPFRVVSLYVGHLRPSDKVRLARILDGYETVRRRGRKRYVPRALGFLKHTGGWRIGRAAIIVPEGAVPALEEILERIGAKRSMVPAWVQEP